MIFHEDPFRPQRQKAIRKWPITNLVPRAFPLKVGGAWNEVGPSQPHATRNTRKELYLPIPITRTTETPAQTTVMIFPPGEYRGPARNFLELKSRFLDVRLCQVNFQLRVSALKERKCCFSSKLCINLFFNNTRVTKLQGKATSRC